MNKAIVIAVAIVVFTSPDAIADGILIVKNDSDASAELWTLPKTDGKYIRPPLYLRRNSGGMLHYRDGEVYWLLVRDEQRHEVPVGWVNIGETMRTHPGSQLRVRSVYETKTEEVEYTVKVWDSRLRRWVQERRTRTYSIKVSKLVPDWVVPE